MCSFQIWVSDLVVGILDVGAVSPLGQDDGLHVFPVQTATLRSVSRWLGRGEVVLEGGNRELYCINVLLMLSNANIYTYGFSPEYNKNLCSDLPKVYKTKDKNSIPINRSLCKK